MDSGEYKMKFLQAVILSLQRVMYLESTMLRSGPVGLHAMGTQERFIDTDIFQAITETSKQAPRQGTVLVMRSKWNMAYLLRRWILIIGYKKCDSRIGLFIKSQDN